MPIAVKMNNVASLRNGLPQVPVVMQYGAVKGSTVLQYAYFNQGVEICC